MLIEALALLPDVDGRIVGGHPREPDLGAAHRAGRGARPRRARPVHRARCRRRTSPARIADADVLVLPNTATEVSARYTSPLKLFEYLAAGRPIVASRLPALAEVLEDDVNALLVAPGDPAALADGDPPADRRSGAGAAPRRAGVRRRRAILLGAPRRAARRRARPRPVADRVRMISPALLALVRCPACRGPLLPERSRRCAR